MPKQLSCALLIECPAGWLLAHATGTPRWDLPKGRLEEGETPMEAALRECREETGLDFAAYAGQLEDFGQHRYLPKKDLHLFRLRLAEVLDLSVCTCTTKCIRHDGQEVYETDAYAWVKAADVPARVGKSLVSYLQDLNLLERGWRPRSRP
jgi:8-oxo-dGTP pyrophosphatase MutT (NUDIX family)